jgi:phosphoglycerate-specific signal transduction histidine kinase
MLPQIIQELTKTQIKIITDNAINEILESGNVIDVADTIAKVQLMITELKKNPKFINYLRDEISKYGKNHVTSSGTKLELCETGVVFDYSQTGDLKYFELLEKQKEINKEIEERENFLKALSKSGEEVRFDDELVKIFPPSKSSNSSYKATIKK